MLYSEIFVNLAFLADVVKMQVSSLLNTAEFTINSCMISHIVSPVLIFVNLAVLSRDVVKMHVSSLLNTAEFTGSLCLISQTTLLFLLNLRILLSYF